MGPRRGVDADGWMRFPVACGAGERMGERGGMAGEVALGVEPAPEPEMEAGPVGGAGLRWRLLRDRLRCTWSATRGEFMGFL